MESASTLFGVSFSQTLRLGQAETVRMAMDHGRSELSVQLPTGYGKTLTAASVYSVLKHNNRVNRLLYVVPTTAQLMQFVQDGAGDLSVAGVTGSLHVTDVGYSGITAIKNHRNNKSQVYACMIQGLNGKNVNDIVNELMKTGRWMVVIDEYHHYGNDAAWGKRIGELQYVFRLSMSATPYRMKNDSAIGIPDLVIKYNEAVGEKAVKKLLCRSYVYRVDLIESDGSVRSYTTDQFIEEVCEGNDNPIKIDQIMIDREMRWSPKYVSPLVDAPISRLLRDRIRFGYPLQALVGTMSCSHAKIVCDQIRSMYPDLRVDWVGTGDNGRPTHENKEVLNLFCPKKKDGRRDPLDIKLDILVHVAMAGEGLDSVFVSEVIHLNPANINNTNNQENGRAARYLEGIVGTINVDSSSPYAQYVGEKIMSVMDDPCVELSTDDEQIEGGSDEEAEGNGNGDDGRLPDEPMFRMFDMECIRIDDGEKKRFAAAILATVKGVSIADLDNTEHQIWKDLENNPDHPAWEKAEMGYRSMRRREQEEHNDRSMVEQWKEKVNEALSFLTGRIVRVISNNQRYNKELLGDVKKRINARKAKEIGVIEKDVMTIKKHYQWILNLETTVIEKGVPEWLL